MNTEVKNVIIATDGKAQYDTSAKRLLAQKNILAHILVRTVDEFKEMKPEEVVSYIEGEPKIGTVPIEPGMTNMMKSSQSGQKIKEMNTEDVEINEGMIRFDIIFYVRMKDGISQIIVNIEAQKAEPIAYKIINRSVFYVSRLISSQKERDFVKSNYDDIKRVFSIWICMNMSGNTMSHIHLVKDDMLGEYNWKGNINLVNIILIGITNELPAVDKKYELHRLISTLLSNQLKPNEKFEIIEKEYGIPLTEDLRKDVNVMCNLSQGIVDDTEMKIVINMYKNNFTLEQISLATKKSIAEIERIINENSIAVPQK